MSPTPMPAFVPVIIVIWDDRYKPFTSRENSSMRHRSICAGTIRIMLPKTSRRRRFHTGADLP